jgi:predicted house-cleaning noncanonical NTP pyrophosphatase (MazG superfamily)
LNSIDSLPKTYLGAQKDSNYPFILLNILKAENFSRNYLNKFQVSFEVCIFARDKAQENLLEMASKVDDVLSNTNFKNDQCRILSIRSRNFEWVKGHDLLTTKLTINYQSLIEAS